MNPSLQSLEPFINDLQHVKIDVDAVSKYGENLQIQNVSDVGFGPFDISVLAQKDKMHLLLLLSATNFCYWGEPKWSPQLSGKDLGGQWGNIFCLLRAIQNGVPLTSATYLAQMTEQECSDLYTANTPIPLLHERWQILREIGEGLQKNEGDFGTFIQKHKDDVWGFLNQLAVLFPSFDDAYTVEGKKLIFHKRAQLLVAFIQHFFPGTFPNLQNDTLTAFADYKQPIALHRLGLITIDQPLQDKIRRLEHIPEGSREEIELRAVQVWICELIRKQLAARTPEISAPTISTHFWLLAKEKVSGDLPHHRTRTIRY